MQAAMLQHQHGLLQHGFGFSHAGMQHPGLQHRWLEPPGMQEPPAGMQHPWLQPPGMQESFTRVEELTDSAAGSPVDSRAASPPPVHAQGHATEPSTAAAEGHAAPPSAKAAEGTVAVAKANTLGPDAFIGMGGLGATRMPSMDIADVLRTTGAMLDKKKDHGEPSTGRRRPKAKGKAKRTKAKATAAAEERDDDDDQVCEDEEDDDEEESEDMVAPVCRRPAAKATAAAEVKAEAAPKNPNVLEYKGTKKMGPRKYGVATIYTDFRNSMWRLKPCAGSKDLEHYSWKKTDPKKMWDKLVKDIKRLTH